jgi:hypothetical protein
VTRQTIQIDNEVREMTEEEHNLLLIVIEENKTNMLVERVEPVAEEPVDDLVEGEQP